MKAKIEFCEIPPGLPANAVVIRDIGHSQGFASITNDAEAVVQTVLRIITQLREPRESTPIYYYDLDNTLSELQHNGVEFTGFGKKVAVHG